MKNAALVDLRLQARKRLVDSAEQFVLRLSAVARRGGLLSGDRPLLTGDPSKKPIVMTGHQPVVFHSGLTFKYQTAEAFAARHGLIAIAVVIDTDEGDAGAFSFPTFDASQGSSQIFSSDTVPQFVSKSTTLAQSHGLFSASRLKPYDVLSKDLTAVETQLRAIGRYSSASAFHTVAGNSG